MCSIVSHAVEVDSIVGISFFNQFNSINIELENCPQNFNLRYRKVFGIHNYWFNNYCDNYRYNFGPFNFLGITARAFFLISLSSLSI